MRSYGEGRGVRGQGSESGLVCKAHKRVYHSNLLGPVSRVITQQPKKKNKKDRSRDLTRTVHIRLPGQGEFSLPWREAGPPNHHDDQVDSDQ